MHDPLQGIEHISPNLTIASVLKFCERQNIGITRGMVQNYIRDGLLPPPINKRFYTHKHMAALVIIDRLKTVFDMPTIKAALQPYMDSEGLPMDVYASIIQKTAGVVNNWRESAAPVLSAESDGGVLLSMVFATELKSAITEN